MTFSINVGGKILGSIVNCFAIIFGGSIGILIKKGISEKMEKAIMNALALSVLYIGLTGSLLGKNILIIIFSLTIGSLLGEWVDLDKRMNLLGNWLENKFKKDRSKSSISQAFVTSSLLFCVGAMAVVGSLHSGLSANNDTLFAKSLIDGLAALILASSLGIGVLLSGPLVLIYEGSIIIFAKIIAPYLTTPVINEMTCIGSLIIIGIGLNMLGISKLKIMNFLPSIFLPIIIYLFIS